jgi:TRAP transporter TAXI family solute receptor
MKIRTAALAFAGLLAAMPALAQERVTYRSAKAGSSYYQMGVQIAEGLRGSGVDVTIEESQGSVQNVMQAPMRGDDYVFTAPPALVDAAREGRGAFEERGSEPFQSIRALFPIPSLTMHFVVAGEVAPTMEALDGRSILLGQGTFGAREGARYLELFAPGAEGLDAELSGAVAALQNGQVDGFVTAGSWPAPNVIEAAATTEVTILALTPSQVAETGRTELTIPAGTYEGQEEDVRTTSLPVVAFATEAMSEDAAYTLTKGFWEAQAALEDSARWWAGVTPDLLSNVTGPIHPGARRYYEEIGVALPDG